MKLFDGHCDTAFELWQRGEGLHCNSCHIDLQRAKKLDAYAQIFAFCSYAGSAGIVETAEAALELPLAALRRELAEHTDAIAPAADAAGIRQAWNDGKAAALFSIEGPEVIGCNPERLAGLRALGFVTTTLTWNMNTPLAGCHASDRGLSPRGRDYVRAAEDCGMYIDVSHLSERAFWELCEVARKPILASHSNCRALRDHSRNLTDDQLRAIAQLGGTVGLNLYVPFLGETADFSTMLAHLEHMLCVCGENHVALGGDLDGCDELPEGFSGVESYPDFYGYLRTKGYEEATLDRIFYKNLLQLF